MRFTTPDFSAPLDLASRLAALPPNAFAKGMFLQSAANRAKAASGRVVGRGRWVPFKDYPFAEWLEVLVESAKLTYPGVPAREGVRRMGRNAYPTFAESMVGKVVLSVPGLDVRAALRLVPRMYQVTSDIATAALPVLEPRRAVLELRSVWDFPDCFAVGAVEGGLAVFGQTGVVRVQSISPCDVDLELVW